MLDRQLEPLRFALPGLAGAADAAPRWLAIGAFDGGVMQYFAYGKCAGLFLCEHGAFLFRWLVVCGVQVHTP